MQLRFTWWSAGSEFPFWYPCEGDTLWVREWVRETEIGKSNEEGFGAVVLSGFNGNGNGNGDVVLFYWLFVFILCLESYKNIKQCRFGSHARGHSCKLSCTGSCALPTEQKGI